MCMCECALRMWQCLLYSLSATITAASTATEIKPELHVRFDCLVLSYRKLYANLTAKSNLHNEMKKSLTDALKAFLKRKEGEKERVIAHTTQHTEQKNHDGKSEWGIGLAMQRGCLFVALLLIVCRCVSFNWLNEWIAIPSQISRTKRNGQNAHASTHDFQSNRAQKKQMQNKNGHETDCRQFTLASFLRKCTLQTSVKQPDFVYRCHVWIWQFDNKEWKCTANQLAPKKGTWTKRYIEALNSTESEKKKRT